MWVWWSARRDILARAFWVALVPGALLFVWMQLRGYARLDMVGVDSHAYWLAARDPQSWYTRAPTMRDAYLYSPPFAQLLWPLGHLPWRVFQLAWASAQVGLLAWLLAPVGWRKALPGMLLLSTDVILGNVYVFYAAVLVLLVRRAPAATVFMLLTKVFPGVVTVYLLVRRDWRSVCVTGLALIAVVGLSAALDPRAWVAWGEFLAASGSHRGGFGVMLARLALSVGVVALAARTGRAWLLVPAAWLSCPFLAGYGPMALAAALPRLRMAGAGQGSAGRDQQHVAGVSDDRVPAPALL